MNNLEVATLLGVIAAFDQRTVGEADVVAWREVALAHRWTLPLARRAVIEHYGAETVRIMPAHITASIALARAAAAKQARAALPAPPVEYRDDPTAEHAWTRQQFDELTSRALTAWAAGAGHRGLYAIEGQG